MDSRNHTDWEILIVKEAAENFLSERVHSLVLNDSSVSDDLPTSFDWALCAERHSLCDGKIYKSVKSDFEDLGLN